MKKQSSKLTLFMIVLCLTTTGIMADMVLIPAAGGLFETFYDTNINLLNFILSGPVLVGGIASLFCNKLAQYISEKKLAIIGFGLITISCVLGWHAMNPVYIAIMRAVFGIGFGIVAIMNMALISKMFIDENKRSTMVGIYNAALSGSGAVLSFIAGTMIAVDWTNAFKIYYVYIPIFILVIFFIPDMKSETEQVKETAFDKNEAKFPWIKVFAMGISFCVFNLLYCVILYQVALVFLDKVLGGGYEAGIAASFGTIGSFVACLTFGLTYKFLKRTTPVVGYFLMAASYLLLYFTTSIMGAVIACAFIGASFGIGMSYYMTSCTLVVPPSKISLSISIMMIGMYLGSFLSTYMTTLLQLTFNTTITGIIPVVSAALGAGAVLSLILTIRNKMFTRNNTNKDSVNPDQEISE